MRIIFLLIFVCVSVAAYSQSDDPVSVLKKDLRYPGSTKIGPVEQIHFKDISYACVTVTTKNSSGKFITKVTVASKERGEWYGTGDSFKSMKECLGVAEELCNNWKKHEEYLKKQGITEEVIEAE